MIAAYLKGFSKSRRIAFSSLEYLFFILEILTFLCYANEESGDAINNNILNKEYLQKYWSNVLQTWHQKCT